MGPVLLAHGQAPIVAKEQLGCLRAVVRGCDVGPHLHGTKVNS